MAKKYRYLKITLLSTMLFSTGAFADCPDALEVKPGASKLVGSLIHGACDVVKDVAGGVALDLVKSVATAIGIIKPKPDTPPLVDLTEASFQRIEEIMQRQISTSLRDYAYSTFRGRAVAIEQGTIHYDAILDEQAKMLYLMNRFLPDVFETTNDGVFYNTGNADIYVLAVPFAGVASAYLALVSRAEKNGQYDVHTAFVTVRDIRNRLSELNSALSSNMRSRITQRASGCYSYPENHPLFYCSITVRSPLGQRTFTSDDFPPGAPAIAVEAAAGNYRSEIMEELMRQADPQKMIYNTLQMFRIYKEQWGITDPW